MAYIGASPSNGVRRKHTYTATASQTTFSGAGAEGAVLSYRDSNYVDVYVNGVKLGDADYTATSGTSIVLGVGAAVNDIVEIMAYDVFSVADTVSKADGGQFDGNVTMAGTLGVTGETTLSANLNLGDNDKAIFGAGSGDLEIYSDGTYSRIMETGGLFLVVDTNGSQISLTADNSKNMGSFIKDGAVQLFYSNAQKFSTTSTGIDVTGVITTDGMTTSADINFGNNDKILMGAGSGGDLRIYHDGTDSVVSSENTTDLYIQANNINLRSSIPGAENGITIAGDGAVTLFHDNVEKLATTSTGIDVTGGFTATDGCTITTADNTAQLTLTSTDADADTGPQLVLDRNSSSPADNDRVGEITFQGRNDANQTTEYAVIQSRIIDASDGTEDGRIIIQNMMAGDVAGVMENNSTETVFNNNSKDLDFRVESDSNANAFFLEGSTGNVGIGTSSPQNLLHLSGGSGTTIMTMARSNSASTGNNFGSIEFQNSAGTVLAGIKGKSMSGNTEAGITFGAGGGNTERMRIDNSGKVGIGTTNPATFSAIPANRLVVGTGSSDEGITIYSSTSTAGTLAFADGTSGDAEYRGFVQYHHNGDYMRFFTAATESMRIDSSGSLLVGKTSAGLSNVGAELHQNGTTFFTRGLPSGDSAGTVYMQRNTSDGNILMFYNSSTSNVGSIGTVGGYLFIGSSSVQETYIGFNNNYVYPSDNDGAFKDNAIDLGNASARYDDIYATNGTINTSDQNEKNTITDSDLGIDFIKRLTPKSYIFNGKTRTHYGLIAQDVETVLGDISKPTSGFAGFIKTDISEAEDGSDYRYGLRYTEFVAPLIQAVKDQQAIIEDLQARIVALENAE